jgi:hypothetical protein
MWLLLAISVFLLALLQVIEEWKLRRLGKRAHKLRSWFFGTVSPPGALQKLIGGGGIMYNLGIDVTLQVIRYAQRNQNRQLWEERFQELGGHTMEFTVLGMRVVMTDEPENVKAILASQFHDFGEHSPPAAGGREGGRADVG